MSYIKTFLEGEVTMLNLMGRNIRDGWHARSIGEIVLKHGRLFEPAPLPEGFKYRKMKRCYQNATRLADMSMNEWTYCEGYATGRCPIPLLHAWCIDEQGRVVDNTWRDGTEYYGIAISRRFHMETMLQSKCYNVLDNMYAEWPALRIDPAQWIDQTAMQLVP